MVSHNANLVIGADSEQVIVANRHGNDRKNKDGRTFEYFTGALEHSRPLNEASATALGRFGIREHARCEILDGGEEAFGNVVRSIRFDNRDHIACDRFRVTPSKSISIATADAGVQRSTHRSPAKR